MIDDCSGDFRTLADGRVELGGLAASLRGWFDARFRRMAQDAGAVEHRFPATLAQATLERAGYFEAFPQGATAVAGDRAWWLPPAVCYHAYAMLEGTKIEAPLRLTAAQTCFREADRGQPGEGRWWDFTMREVIFVGPGEWVRAERDCWASRVQQFAEGLGLEGELAAATDPFFGPVGRGKLLLQQIKELKRELCLRIGDGTLPVASFNLHETFFGRRFAMRLSDGREASSGCVAWGLERWALALLRQRGPRAAKALTAGDRTGVEHGDL